MSKHQHGNKEAKKPKRVQAPAPAQLATEAAVRAAVAVAERPKRK